LNKQHIEKLSQLFKMSAALFLGGDSLTSFKRGSSNLRFRTSVDRRMPEPLWIITNVTRRFRFAARHFIACARRSSAAPFHELVKGFEIRARFAVSKKLRRLQSRKLFSHRCGDELVYACPIFLALSLHCPL
jgi:hypothetical protein